MAPVQQLLLDLPHKNALSSHLVQGAVQNPVSPGGDDGDGKAVLGIGGLQPVDHPLGLGQSQGAAPGCLQCIPWKLFLRGVEKIVDDLASRA